MVVEDSNDDLNELKKSLNAYIKLVSKQKKEIKELRQSTTVEVQSGNFTKKIFRKGKKKSQKLVRFKRNPEKLSLGWIGHMEFFCYPYTSLEKVFVRVGSSVVPFDKYDLPRLFNMHNRSKWIMDNAKRFLDNKLDTSSPLAKELKSAYDAGYDREQKEINDNFKRENDELFEAMIEMKESVRRKWFNDDPELKTQFEKYLKQKIKGNRKKNKNSDRKT